jgi:hypothetical protein
MGRQPWSTEHRPKIGPNGPVEHGPGLEPILWDIWNNGKENMIVRIQVEQAARHKTEIAVVYKAVLECG